jgi:hypothetical protein
MFGTGRGGILTFVCFAEKLLCCDLLWSGSLLELVYPDCRHDKGRTLFFTLGGPRSVIINPVLVRRFAVFAERSRKEF